MAHGSSDFWAAIDPVMNREFYGLEAKHKNQCFQIFEQGSDEEPQRSFVEYGGPASYSLKAENAAVSQKSIIQGPVKTHTTATYAAACTISMEAAKDTKLRYSKISQTAGSMGRAAAITPEILTALFLDRAFNSSYPVTADSLELCSTVHLIPDGTSYNNELATPAALSETTMEDVHTELMTQTGPDGNIMPLTVKKWVVPAALHVKLWKLLNTTKEFGTANNTESYVADKGGKGTTFSFLGSNTRFFALTDANLTAGLFWDWIEKNQFITDQVPLNLQKVYIGYFRARFGVGDPRCIFGVAAT